MEIGDHIKVRRLGYWHHGIYLGNGRVVQYSGEPIPTPDSRIGTVLIEEFSQGKTVVVVSYAVAFSADRVVKRAISRLGEQSYDFRFNNCEHFATWCKTGVNKSQQTQMGGAVAVGLISGAVTRIILSRAAAGLLLPVGGPLVAAVLAGLTVYQCVRIARDAAGASGPIRLGEAA
jgi:hypothetical protein